MNIQDDLNSAYQLFKDSVDLPSSLTERLSPPLLLQVPQRWIDAKKRILIVGQETLGWDFESGSYYTWNFPKILTFSDFQTVSESVDALVYGYRQFEFSRYQPQNYRSPFWRAYRQIRSAIGEDADGFETSVLWTNLFRMSLDYGSVVWNGTSSEVELIRNSAGDLLKTEFKLLQPTSIVFFTGPYYDQHLGALFPECQFLDFFGHDPTRTGILTHPDLPKSWRTYHPGYLARGHWHIVDQIVGAACSA